MSWPIEIDIFIILRFKRTFAYGEFDPEDTTDPSTSSGFLGVSEGLSS